MSRVGMEMVAKNRLAEAAELLGGAEVSISDVASGESVPVKLVVKKPAAKKRSRTRVKKRA